MTTNRARFLHGSSANPQLTPGLSRRSERVRQAYYDKAIAPAWDAYARAMVAARVAHDKATATAWASYHEARDAAKASYNKARDAAWVAYHEAMVAARIDGLTDQQGRLPI